MSQTNLEQAAKELVEKPRGILAMDESTGTIAKRLESVGLQNNEENRRDYRHMIVSAQRLGKFISGAILYDETFWQVKDGKKLIDFLKEQNIKPGIKVDTGAKENPNFPGGLITEGLDGLPERLKKYYANGAVFAKWRAVITVVDSPENSALVLENMKRLAKYAKMCQQAQIVPIVEPEVLMDGSHSIDQCYKKTHEALSVLFRELKKAEVNMKAVLLKPNMIIDGKDSNIKSTPQVIADKTVQVLKKCVSPEVPGVVFLSGGLSDDDATLYLKLMNQPHINVPWKLSFSYGRALVSASLKKFAQFHPKGPYTEAQKVLLKRAKACSDATRGV